MKNVLEYLEKTASVKHDQQAVVMEGQSVSWAQLAEISQQIGTGLAKHVKPKTPVPVLAEKGIDTLCAFFGIVYAGCFYIMLNPQLPEARLKSILDTLESPCLLTDAPSAPLAHSLSTNVIEIDELKVEANYGLLNKIRTAQTDSDPLYALFTSGSTGVPKGVLVSHRNVIDFIDTFTGTFDIGEGDVIANQAPFDFDVSVKDIYSSIKTGAKLVLVPKHLFSQPTELTVYLEKNGVTTLIWAVSALCLISTFHCLDYCRPQLINKILFSGEVMPVKHLKEWMSYYPDAVFVNLYGPTEITCNCTYHIVNNNDGYENGIPIGRAFKNREVFLLDNENNLVTESGKTGEICVRGVSVAMGYFNNPQQTALAFVQNPLNKKYTDIIYRTGDLGKYNEDGELVFSGRKDFQIKHMGHRIELEEIERAMTAINKISRACCVFDEKKSKLFGFYTGNLEKKELHGVLSKTLPVYMIPGALRQIEEFPLNKNGKIDRKLLFEMYGGRRR